MTAGATSGSGSTATSASSSHVAVHQISVAYHPADYESLISAYLASGQKVWIGGSATIDGITYADVGLRLAGASLDTDEEDEEAAAISPGKMPWLITLDKYVDGQQHEGATDFLVHTNTGVASPVEA